jgi:hypothetical protein
MYTNRYDVGHGSCHVGGLKRQEYPMRRLISLLSVVVLIAISMAWNLSAQEASPPAAPLDPPDSFEIAPGVVADNMVFVEGAEAPVSYRLTFEPGVVYDVVPGPTLDLGYMESGSLVMTLDAPVTVKQINDAQGEGEMYSAGTGFTLETGDFLVLQPGVGGEIRNDSDEPASLLVSALTPGGTGMATPEASPAG